MSERCVAAKTLPMAPFEVLEEVKELLDKAEPVVNRVEQMREALRIAERELSAFETEIDERLRPYHLRADLRAKAIGSRGVPR